MGLWDDIKSSASDVYGAYDKYMWGGYLPGGEDPNDPARGANSPYRDPNKENFDLPGYQGIQDRYGGYLDQIDNRNAPTLGAPSSFRGDQQALADLLMGRAEGRNSVAEQQLRQGAEMSNRQQQSYMAGSRPGNSALAMRLGMENQANTMMGLGGQTALARAQEANMASQSLGGVLQGARGFDEQRSLAELEAAQRQMALNDQARQGLLGGSLAASGLQQQGGMGYEGARTNRYGVEMGVPTNSEQFVGGIKDLLKMGLV